jgi:hypothetical protein
MYAVIRQYSGASQMFGELIRRKQEVEDLIRSVQGFQAYYLIRGEDGGATVTVCDDRAGAEESTRMAAEWVGKNLGGMSGTKPQVTQGEVGIGFWK